MWKKIKSVRVEDGEEVAYATMKNSYRNLYEPTDEKIEAYAWIKNYEKKENGFSCDSIIKLTKKVIR